VVVLLDGSHRYPGRSADGDEHRHAYALAERRPHQADHHRRREECRDVGDQVIATRRAHPSDGTPTSMRKSVGHRTGQLEARSWRSSSSAIWSRVTSRSTSTVVQGGGLCGGAMASYRRQRSSSSGVVPKSMLPTVANRRSTVEPTSAVRGSAAGRPTGSRLPRGPRPQTVRQVLAQPASGRSEEPRHPLSHCLDQGIASAANRSPLLSAPERKRAPPRPGKPSDDNPMPDRRRRHGAVPTLRPLPSHGRQSTRSRPLSRVVSRRSEFRRLPYRMHRTCARRS
jgi:hypothetical protein